MSKFLLIAHIICFTLSAILLGHSVAKMHVGMSYYWLLMLGLNFLGILMNIHKNYTITEKENDEDYKS